MLLRKAFFTHKVVLLFCAVFVAFAGMAPVKGEEKEKSELARLMGKIDTHYKALERLATYFSFDEVEKGTENLRRGKRRPRCPLQGRHNKICATG